jgi:hypothetical protein
MTEFLFNDFNDDPDYIDRDVLNDARQKLRGCSPATIADVQTALVQGMPDRPPSGEAENRFFIRWLHIFGDTYSCAGEYDTAEAFYTEALLTAETELADGPKARAYQALLHVSLAEIARVTEKPTEEIFAHTSKVSALMSGYSRAWRADLIRFFCFRTLMLDSVTRHTDEKDYFEMQFDNLSHLEHVQDFLQDYEPGSDVAPPLSAYFPMPS